MIFLLDYRKKYWDSLMAKIENEYGVAGLMGNLDAESGLLPYRKQGDMISPYVASQQYTNNVDSGAITKNQFCTDQIGYGLAQWTIQSRKTQLYDFKTEMKTSIGSYELSLKMLFYELEGSYYDVWQVLRSAPSVRVASDYVLHNYEMPEDQSEAVEIARAALGQQIYDEFHGTEPTPTPQNNTSFPFWFYFLD